MTLKKPQQHMFNNLMNLYYVDITLLQTSDLSHNVVSTTTFRAEYRRTGSSSMFSRNVRFQVDITPAHGGPQGDCSMFCLTFTLISGKISHSLK